jgi:carboxylate-amine ligase
MGRLTGLKSYRTIVWQQFPRTGIPEEFASWSEFENYVNLLVKTNSIDNGKKLWWDLRPHPLFNTLEFRVCDMPATADETIALVALFQALVAKLYKLRMQNLGFRMYSRALIEENKWRAARYGLDGKLIDFGKQQEVPMRDLVVELLDFVDDVVDGLGSRAELQTIRRIIETGTGADRQIAVYTATQSTRAVVDWLCDETLRGIAL